VQYKDLLSQQEQNICADRRLGLMYKEIAFKRKISISTVKTHLSRIFGKLHITSSLELQRYTSNLDTLAKPNHGLTQEEMHPISAKIQALLKSTDRSVARLTTACRISNGYVHAINARPAARR
jgi:DNA-binding CsgD family transcriptional regulator